MMIFHHRQRNVSKINLELFINDNKIKQVKEFDFLGLILDECMTWNAHTNKIAGKMSRVNGVLTRLKKVAPSDILKLIYNSLIQPHLNYGILLWTKNTKSIKKLQKWSLRAITSSKYNAHTEPLFLKLQLLNIEDTYTSCLLKFYYKYQNDLLPKFFSGMFNTTNISHKYETRQRGQSMIARCATKTAKSSIRFSLPVMISRMDKIVLDKVMTHSMSGFSNYAKKFLIKRYKPNCEITSCYICNK